MDPIEEINIQEVGTPSWMYTTPSVPDNYVPVTINLGFPVVDLPGCVEYHQDNKKDYSKTPLDRDLVNDDEDGMTILCPHGQYPSYNTINYEPEQLTPVIPTPPPKVNNRKEEREKKEKKEEESSAEPLGIPNASIPNIPTNEIECPAPGQPRVGDLTSSGDEKVIGHEIENNICVVLYEPTTVVEKYLPSSQLVTSTAGIAVVATTSALLAKPLADVLLKVVKPVVKKLITSLKKKFGSETKRPTLAEVRTDKYREKKGLPPIKKKPIKKK